MRKHIIEIQLMFDNFIKFVSSLQRYIHKMLFILFRSFVCLSLCIIMRSLLLLGPKTVPCVFVPKKKFVNNHGVKSLSIFLMAALIFQL